MSTNVLQYKDTGAYYNSKKLLTEDEVTQASGTTGQVQFNSGTNTFQADSNLYWDNTNKRLGVGTSSPQRSLEVTGTEQQVLITDTDYSGAGKSWALESTTGNFSITEPGIGMPLVIQNTSGNIGVGTTTPSAKLHIDNGVSNNLGLLISSNGPGWGSGLKLSNQESAQTYGIYTGGSTLPGKLPGTFSISDDNTGMDRLVIVPNGNIGIGTTTPLEKLVVSGGSLLIDASEQAQTSGNFLANHGIFFRSQLSPNAPLTALDPEIRRRNVSITVAPGSGGNTGDALDYNAAMGHTFYTAGFGTVSASAIIDSSGNVGIGTTTPSAKLDIQHGSVKIGDGTNEGGEGLYINTGWIEPADYTQSRPFEVKVRDVDQFVVNTNGNVGINATNPSEKLEVVGAIKVSDVQKTREYWRLPMFDEQILTDVDAFRESGWRLATPSATGHAPNSDYNWIFTKMVNSSFGQQESYGRADRMQYTRFFDANVWTPWYLTGSMSWSGTTSNSTPTDLRTYGSNDGNAYGCILNPDSAITFSILVTAKNTTTNDVNSYMLQGTAKRDGSGSAQIVGVTDKTVITQTDTTLDVNLVVINAGFTLQVTGNSTNTVKWSAKADLNEVRFDM